MTGYLKLMRPMNMFLAGAAVLLGGWLSGAGATTPALLRVALGAALIASAGYVLNDVGDVNRDRRNHPHRPLVSGGARVRPALVMAAILAAVGLSLVSSGGHATALLAVAWVAALTVYELRAKHELLWGNLLVGLVTGSAFIAGGLVAPDPRASFVPAGFAFLYHLAREMWKDAADVDGDRATGAQTLAARHGPAGGLRAASMIFMLLIAMTPFPYLAGWYNARYLAVVLPGVDLLLIGLIVAALIHPTRALAARTQGMLKFGMAAGMCAIALGRL